jgi:tryptophanyl-tRNA synthetase
MNKPVILTGLRANAEFTLGNYLGAILPMIELQKKFAGDYRLNMFVPDLHSFTTPIEHSKLYQQVIHNLKTYIAAGLDVDNEDTYIYRQSYVGAHSELAIILNNFAYYGELQRMTQFKEKSAEAKDGSVTAGLFDYPILMAADILLYGAEWIPLGEDQRQHVELTRDLALRVNAKFTKDIFVVPAEWDKQVAFAGRSNGVRIRSLRNPEKKMSKSIDDPAGTILLSDNPDKAAKKVLAATTDSLGVINYDMAKQPGISNLIQILALLVGQPVGDIANEWAGRTSYGDLKTAVADELRVFLTNLQQQLNAVDEAELMRKLEVSELLMRDIASQRLYTVQQSIGLRP